MRSVAEERTSSGIHLGQSLRRAAGSILLAALLPLSSASAAPQFISCGGQLMRQDNGNWIFWGTDNLPSGFSSDIYLGLSSNARTQPRRLRSFDSVAAAFCNRRQDVLHLRLTDGRLLGYGRNNLGQIGKGDQTGNFGEVLSFQNAEAVVGGQEHTLALLTGGSVAAWGRNDFGQVGDGTTFSPRAIPRTISGLAGVIALAAGDHHNLALLLDGTVAAWGLNASGQLGDGTTTTRSGPVLVSGLTGVVAIEAGANHSVALKSDGTVWAWGENSQGEIGNGASSFTGQRTPVRVGLLSNIVSIRTASNGAQDYTIALQSDGSVWAWGASKFSDIGVNILGAASGGCVRNCPPVKVTGLPTNVNQIYGGFPAGPFNGAFARARTADGKIFSWGSQNTAQFGRPFDESTSSVVPVLTVQGVVSSDFDLDYSSDLLLRNTTTGEIQLSNVVNLAVDSSGSLGTVSTNWQIVGLGDADGDGKDDIFWRNSVTNENSVWFMDNRRFKGTIPLPTVADVNWRVAAVADMNGDSLADLVWRNEPGGLWAVWILGPSGVVASRAYGGVPAEWEIRGAADFNGDRNADIIWRNRNGGAVAIYRMSGVEFVGVNFLAGGLADWDVVHVGDLDRDGVAEVLFLFRTGASLAVWDLNSGATAVSRTTFLNGPGGDWRLTAVGDYDADTHSDFLWRSAGTGDLVLWRLVNLTIPSPPADNIRALGNPGPGWVVIGR